MKYNRICFVLYIVQLHRSIIVKIKVIKEIVIIISKSENSLVLLKKKSHKESRKNDAVGDEKMYILS
jgi:hypothetical protein